MPFLTSFVMRLNTDTKPYVWSCRIVKMVSKSLKTSFFLETNLAENLAGPCVNGNQLGSNCQPQQSITKPNAVAAITETGPSMSILQAVIFTRTRSTHFDRLRQYRERTKWRPHRRRPSSSQLAERLGPRKSTARAGSDGSVGMN